MRKLLFCNIGWMDRYEGQTGKPDRIVGGGAHVKKNKRGQEVCNFLAVQGHVYGHVETIKGQRDRMIRIQSLGAGNAESVSNIDVIWTATHPEQGGRRVIGWYQDATIFRERQYFNPIPSKQHQKEGITSFRIVAKVKTAHLIDIHKRTLELKRGRNWMGHTPWWVPKPGSDPEVNRFLQRLSRLIASMSSPAQKQLRSRSGSGRGSPAASHPYVRYVEKYEATITPQHHKLQRRFERHLKASGHSGFEPDTAGVDLRYQDSHHGMVFAEIKPCDKKNCRYAIRTGIGQLLDYQQRCADKVNLLLALGCEPEDFDKKLALSNGFGIAYPHSNSFDIEWPRRNI